MQNSIRPRLMPLVIFMVMVALMRMGNSAQLTPWANFSPIGAMALFGGAYFKPRWVSFAFPLLTLLLSDLLIQQLVFKGRHGVLYGGWYIVYAAFAGIALIGMQLGKKVTVGRFVLAGLGGSLCHWLVADFFVWAGGGTDLRTMLPLSRNLDGLVQCYWQGLPFFRNFLAGTLVYGGIMFGLYEWLKVYKTNWVMQKSRA